MHHDTIPLRATLVLMTNLLTNFLQGPRGPPGTPGPPGENGADVSPQLRDTVK